MKRIDVEVLKRLAEQQKKGNPMVSFLDSDEKIMLLAQKIHDSSSEEALKLESRKNALVSTVTQFEVYLKRIVPYYHGRWNREGLDELMKETISLKDAFELVRASNIKEEHVIIHTQNFQNLNAITYVFNQLTKKQFMMEIERLRNNLKEKDIEFLVDFDDLTWQGALAKSLEVRHSIVHEGHHEVTQQDLNKFRSTLFGFIVMIELLLIQYFDPARFKKLIENAESKKK